MPSATGPSSSEPQSRRGFYQVVLVLATLWLLTTGLCSGGFFLSFVVNSFDKSGGGDAALRDLIYIPIVCAILALPLGFVIRGWAKRKLKS